MGGAGLGGVQGGVSGLTLFVIFRMIFLFLWCSLRLCEVIGFGERGGFICSFVVPAASGGVGPAENAPDGLRGFGQTRKPPEILLGQTKGWLAE